MTSTIKVDNIQDQDGNNIINENSNTITIGASGDTVTLASGASQSGFGRTGTVDWQTGSIKTANFTASNGEGYFCNTTSGSFTVTLPAGSAGAIVSVQDYNNTFDTNGLTVLPNGSEKINGGTGGVHLITEGEGLTLVYIDSTVGWRSIQDNDFATVGSNFVSATGGTILTCGNFKTHIFTSPGTFTVTAAGSPAGSDTVDYLVVAGGGGAQGDRGGGGGAGGFRVSNSVGCVPAPTMSPLANPTGLPVSIQGYPITVGAGGAGINIPAAGNGGTSTFSTITSAGGGGSAVSSSGNTGGSGSGGYCNPGAAGNTPPVSPPQGNPGGTGAGGPQHGAGGGGGAGATGSNGTPGGAGGAGGAGSFVAVAFMNPGCAPTYGEPGPVGSTRYFAGGGGASFYGDPGPGTPGAGGVGGGGDGANCSPGNGSAGVANTGGGGGGGVQKSGPGTGGGGGSGIVMIRYKFQ